MSGKSEEAGVAGKEEAQDPARESVTKPELTPDQRTFLIMMKMKNTSYKDILVEWTKQFARKPPSRKTVFRVLKRAQDDNTVLSRKREGRKQTVRTKAIVEEVKRVLEEESEATPGMPVN